MKIYIAGDSTAACYTEDRVMVGWGQVLGDFLPGAEVHDEAMAGRSTRTFLSEGRLDAMDGGLGEGDLLLVQFAHNDEGDKPERHTEPWDDFTENLRTFIRFARERGAQCVLLTPICMRVWKDGELQETHGEYPEAMRVLAREEGVPLVDVYRESFLRVREAGEEGSKAFFMHFRPGEDPRFPEGNSDNAHTKRAGAVCFAGIVARGLRELGLVE